MLYAILIAAGGMISYFRMDSPVTLIISVAAGLILVIGAIMTNSGSFGGVYISLLVSFGLGIFFGLRYTKLGGIMPTGLLTIISMFALGFNIYALSNKEQFSSSDKDDNPS